MTRGELLENPKSMEEFRKIKSLNDSAKSVYTLYSSEELPCNEVKSLGRTLTSTLAATQKKNLRDSLVRAHKEGLSKKSFSNPTSN